MTVVELQNVSKRFRRHTGPQLVRERLRDLLRPKPDASFYALRNVSFRIRDGESVALVGSNGAGKSTTLSLIAGLAHPDEGRVSVSGRIAALLELGSGFHPDLTGAENVLLNAALLGMSRRAAKAQLEAIVDFSEIGDFIREPLRTYSSGMVVRLAFSVAVHVEPAILIVDEVLGVGDNHFQEKSMAKIMELRQQGKTLLCVSHNAEAVEAFCERAIWLDRGEIMSDGSASRILREYTQHTSYLAART
jgi:lipopolysaccharide transport system ATP-binding protein